MTVRGKQWSEAKLIQKQTKYQSNKNKDGRKNFQSNSNNQTGSASSSNSGGRQVGGR